MRMRFQKYNNYRAVINSPSVLWGILPPQILCFLHHFGCCHLCQYWIFFGLIFLVKRIHNIRNVDVVQILKYAIGPQNYNFIVSQQSLAGEIGLRAAAECVSVDVSKTPAHRQPGGVHFFVPDSERA